MGILSFKRVDCFKEYRFSARFEKSPHPSILQKAIVLYKSIRLNNEGLFMNTHPNVDLSKCCSENRLKLPEYVYDCHTYIGKAKGELKRISLCLNKTAYILL